MRQNHSDVYRRQILTHKDGPRAERVKFRASLVCLNPYNAEICIHHGIQFEIIIHVTR